MKKIIIIPIVLILVSLLFTACEKPSTSEPKKVDQAQTSQTENKEPPQPEQQKTSQPAKKSVQELSPLERARGKEVKDENGLPIVTWGSLKDLPTLDEVFPPLAKIPEEKELFHREAQSATLAETQERKELRKNIHDDIYDYLNAVESPNRQCIVELYCGSPHKGKECWMRGIDPNSNKVLWKHNEPGLIEDILPQMEFAMEANYFIMTSIKYSDPVSKQYTACAVKLFSCQSGFLRDIYKRDYPCDDPGAVITPDGKNILLTTTDGNVKKYDIEGKVLWEKQVNPYKGLLHPLYISLDSIYFVSFYRSPENASLESRRREGLPQELQLIEIKSGNTKLKNRFFADLGDKSMITNTMEIRGIISTNKIIGIWLMDGIGYIGFLEKKPNTRINPYGNVAVLFTKKNIYAFRIQSLGFSFTKDGSYLSANNKLYDIRSLLNKEGLQ